MTKTIVWDIGNVFALWQPEAYYDQMIGRDARLRMFEETGLMEMNEAIDLGAPCRATAYAKAEEFPEWRAPLRAWFDDWRETFRISVPGTADLFRAAKQHGTPCVSLTNFGAETLDMAKELHPVLTEFDQEFVSAWLGLAKPDPAIYAAVEAGTGLTGADLLFTDDRPENIEAAAMRGWNTHLFDGAEGLRDRLRAENLVA